MVSLFRIQMLFFGLILLVFHPNALANEITGKIVRIVDGDTVILLTDEKKQVKIRLAGIDAPE